MIQETKQDGGADRHSVRAVDRALSLLGCFSEGEPVLTLSEFSRLTKLPISTVSRLLATLEAAEFVRRTPAGYTFGIRLLQISLATLHSVPVYDLAAPHLLRLTELTGESCFLALPAEQGMVVYVHESPSPKPIKYSTWLGRPFNRGGTAIGAAIDGQVGASGFVSTRSTIDPDTTAIAVPIHGRDGKIVAGINVVGPTFRISDEDIERYGAFLVDLCAQVSREIGASLSLK